MNMTSESSMSLSNAYISDSADLTVSEKFLKSHHSTADVLCVIVGGDLLIASMGRGFLFTVLEAGL